MKYTKHIMKISWSEAYGTFRQFFQKRLGKVCSINSILF